MAGNLCPTLAMTNDPPTDGRSDEETLPLSTGPRSPGVAAGGSPYAAHAVATERPGDEVGPYKLDLFPVDEGGGSAFLPTGPSAKPFLGVAPNPCPADLDHNGVVNGADLGLLLSNWGGSGTGDLNGDGTVDGADLGLLLSAWGPCGN